MQTTTQRQQPSAPVPKVDIQSQVDPEVEGPFIIRTIIGMDYRITVLDDSG